MKGVELSNEVQQQIQHIGSADIVIGIPSYNNARTIGHVVRAAQAGLAKYFFRSKSVLVNADGGSTDGTIETVHDATIDSFESVLIAQEREPLRRIAMPYSGIPGKGSAFRTIFEIAVQLNAGACVVVDSDLRSITPEWIELLLKPVLEGGFDYVAPLYQRHKFDGTITNSIVYPLTRVLYGKRVRQPIGGDFGFSGKLAQFYLSKDVWETDVAKYGIDIWMTTTAIANDYRVCQAYLGAKIHDPKDPGSDLSAMLSQVVGATFDLMEEYSHIWKYVKGSEPVPDFGFRYDVGLEPVHVNTDRMIDLFRLGARELGIVWKELFPEDIVTELHALSLRDKKDFVMSDDVWTRIIYAYAVAAHRKTMNREHLLKSLTPLYLGRTASFVMEVWESGAAEVEERLERLCYAFEENKGMLTQNW